MKIHYYLLLVLCLISCSSENITEFNLDKYVEDDDLIFIVASSIQSKNEVVNGDFGSNSDIIITLSMKYQDPCEIQDMTSKLTNLYIERYFERACQVEIALKSLRNKYPEYFKLSSENKLSIRNEISKKIEFISPSDAIKITSERRKFKN